MKKVHSFSIGQETFHEKNISILLGNFLEASATTGTYFITNNRKKRVNYEKNANY